MHWVLGLSKGLLRTFNARYAAFFFDPDQVVLDVLPIWSKTISRFICERRLGGRPAEDLKNLILQSGREWYELLEKRHSKGYASLFLLQKNHVDHVDPETIKPENKVWLRLSKNEKGYMRILELDEAVLSTQCNRVQIRTAYRRMAKNCHPDLGGDEEKFKLLNEAHQKMLLWVQHPKYTSKRALKDCWSYDGYTNRWTPPL
jgi:hypothetical protein